jgi:nitroreductase
MTRNFSGAVPIDELTHLCDAARHAPSAGFSQGTHFLILSDTRLAEFWSASGSGEWFEKVNPGVLRASACVVVLGDRRSYLDRYSAPDKAGHGLEDAEGWPTPFWLTDAAMAAQNLLLLIEERRWGALFFGLFGRAKDTLATFGVPPEVDCVGAIAVGHRSSDDRPSGSSGLIQRRRLDEQVHLGRW